MKHLRILLTLAIGFAATLPAKADTTVGTPILTLPTLITKPGKYRLTKSLVNVGNGTAISVIARDVVIDLNGFSILGLSDQKNDNTCIVTSAPNTIIRNGTIRKFNTAISDLGSANGTLVEDVVCVAQTSAGIRFIASDVVLRRVTVRNTGAGHENSDDIFGIFLSGSSVIDSCVLQNIPDRPDVNTNVAIRLAAGSHAIRETDIHHAGGTAISTSSDISTILERVRIRECGTGLSILTGQPPLLRESTIRDCVTSVLGTFDDGGRNNITQ
jgi:hypothetical protein